MSIHNNAKTFGYPFPPPTNSTQRVLPFDNFAAFPTTGASGFIYVDLEKAESYLWNGTKYVAPNEGVVPKIIKADFTVNPLETKTIPITLPTPNLAYELSISGSVDNGVISYSAKILTTNPNTPILLTRLAHMYFQGENLRLIDPITYATNEGLYNVITAETNGLVPYAVIDDGLGLQFSFQVTNSNSSQVATCKYLITYTTA